VAGPAHRGPPAWGCGDTPSRRMSRRRSAACRPACRPGRRRSRRVWARKPTGSIVLRRMDPDALTCVDESTR
jgi:hypothetical protein